LPESKKLQGMGVGLFYPTATTLIFWASPMAAVGNPLLVPGVAYIALTAANGYA